MKRILLALALAASANAHAGFITGYLVGRALSGDGDSGTPTAGSVLVSSETPGHSVITCRKHSSQELCAGIKKVWNTYAKRWEDADTWYTPNEYAGVAGYKWTHKLGTAIVNNVVYIVMEVSK